MKPSTRTRKPKPSKENAPPADSNIVPSPSGGLGKAKGGLPPRPPNPLKRKIGSDFQPESGGSGCSDTGVK
ncbi:hypothetical protein Tco_1268423, partial [Tanacetum coccineum]